MRSTGCLTSVEREQQAIDLRIEARLAFAALGNIEQWFGLCREAEARSEKIGDEGRRLASIAVRAAGAEFLTERPMKALSPANRPSPWRIGSMT